jgi:hypothetical protein
MSKPKQSKTAFVLSLPESTGASEVVSLANKRGIKISRQYVYVIRANAHQRNGRHPSSSESAMRTAIAELGLTRARQVLAEVERAFR